MNYGCITVRCPRCNSVIKITSGNTPAEIFNCPVCAEGEIHYVSSRPARQPVGALRQENPRLEQYITTPGNIWIN